MEDISGIREDLADIEAKVAKMSDMMEALVTLLALNSLASVSVGIPDPDKEEKVQNVLRLMYEDRFLEMSGLLEPIAKIWGFQDTQ